VSTIRASRSSRKQPCASARRRESSNGELEAGARLGPASPCPTQRTWPPSRRAGVGTRVGLPATSRGAADRRRCAGLRWRRGARSRAGEGRSVQQLRPWVPIRKRALRRLGQPTHEEAEGRRGEHRVGEARGGGRRGAATGSRAGHEEQRRRCRSGGHGWWSPSARWRWPGREPPWEGGMSLLGRRRGLGWRLWVFEGAAGSCSGRRGKKP
jgi:hypothetical protein